MIKKKTSIWPIVFAKQLLILNPEASVCIVSLWDDKNFIHNLLNEETKLLVCAIGNAYGRKNFLKPITVNFLANRYIRKIIICGQDNDLSKSAIIDIFRDKIIPEDMKDLCDSFMPSLKDAQDQICYVKVSTYNSINSDIKELHEMKCPGIERDCIDVRSILETPNSFAWPRQSSGYLIRMNDTLRTYKELLRTILLRGEKIKYGETELLQINNTLAVFETPPVLDEIDGIFDNTRDRLESYRIAFESGYKPESVTYTYGERVKGYIKKIVDTFKSDVFSKKCYIPVYLPQDIDISERPCMVGIHLLYVNSRLNITAVFRSHDVFKAYIMNLYAVTSLQRIIAEATGLECGSITVLSMSAHIYMDDYQRAFKKLENDLFDIDFTEDKEGFYQISRNEDNIIVEYIDLCTQQKLFTYEESYSNYQDLIYKVCSKINSVQHAAFVSREITLKAIQSFI